MPQLLKPARRNYWAHVSQLLKPAHSRARVPQLLSPQAATTEARTPGARASQQEKPPQWEARAPQRRVAPAATKTQRSQKKKKRIGVLSALTLSFLLTEGGWLIKWNITCYKALYWVLHIKLEKTKDSWQSGILPHPICEGVAGTGEGAGHVIQGAQLGQMNLDRQNYGERAHREGSEGQWYFLGRGGTQVEWLARWLFLWIPILKIYCLLFSAPWKHDPCGLHHLASLALWLPIGFDRRSEGRRREGVRVFPAVLAVVASLYNHSFYQEALLPWLQLFGALITCFPLLALGL